ncbi:DUF817 domain-containing protein [Propionibacteriaceae bacterium Y1685]
MCLDRFLVVGLDAQFDRREFGVADGRQLQEVDHGFSQQIGLTLRPQPDNADLAGVVAPQSADRPVTGDLGDRDQLVEPRRRLGEPAVQGGGRGEHHTELAVAGVRRAEQSVLVARGPTLLIDPAPRLFEFVGNGPPLGKAKLITELRHGSRLPFVRACQTDPVPREAESTERLPLTRLRGLITQLFRFAWIEAQCCGFAIAVFAGLAISSAIWSRVDPPIARYDVLLIFVVGVQALFLIMKWETWRELLVICAFHVVGLALEIFKVTVGSWVYPDPGLIKVGGVPLYSGFMYASVGSYICQAFRRFDLRVTGYRWLPVSLLAVAAYANFFTHHFTVDLRVPIAIGFLITLWGSRVHFTVGRERYWMPVWLSFLLIGFFLWVAENAGTFLGAWRYPDQVDVWQMVHTGKLGSWALLVSLSFVLVSAVKAQEGRLYGDRPPDVVPRTEWADQ